VATEIVAVACSASAEPKAMAGAPAPPGSCCHRSPHSRSPDGPCADSTPPPPTLSRLAAAPPAGSPGRVYHLSAGLRFCITL